MNYLSPETRAAIERLIAADDSASTPDALERLASIRSARAALEADPATLAAVRDAVSAGRSWDEISAAAGLKPAAAKWRWQGSDEEIAERLEAGRKRSARPSSVPTGLPGLSVADAAKALGVTPQAVYLRVSRGGLRAEVVTLADGRSYKRVFLDDAQ
ncbi:hypothetical protein [Homoserinimonas hongtaonis]|uniref:Uncharacterized protein n=1 Tax=Homoserinimonas hongtaonis TaxID=2079791 RepID=A0A2U1SWK2_9MICO|nr:hypothetical protein [Salinibacterium hongtaonis]PWB95968.1 hypothetical protein DF220_11200 [Salinibacterium hongtaonis]